MVDVSECDREPIHIPGSIQPFGVLLALSEPELVVTQVSDNVRDHLSIAVEAVLGSPLTSFMVDTEVDQLRATLREERCYADTPLEVVVGGKRFDAIVHRHEGVAILELEPPTESAVGSSANHPFRGALIRMQHTGTVEELASVIVEEIRRITGYERVLFYRFHDDGSGSVDAEAGGEGNPYLGLRYPASDIPAQARRLYQLNWLRFIFDTDATPARLIPPRRPDTGGPLDLSFSILRSVSPIHIEYMKNMGVRASMSISLVVGDRLWGLISCLHHSAPRRVSHAIRSACEFLGRLASLQITAFEDRNRLAARAAVRAIEEALGRVMRAACDDVLASLVVHTDELLGLVGATGAAVVSPTDVLTCGRTPPREAIREIAVWLEGRTRPFATSALGELFPPARGIADVASGLLTFALPRSRLLWFRPEIIQTVNWGGEPTKPLDANERLRPRHSFAAWKQEVRGTSRPWAVSDLDTANELQRRAIEVDVERRLTAEQQAVRVRDDVIAVVSHDLRNPLNAIALQTNVLSLRLGTDANADMQWIREGVDRIEKSAARMKALVDDLLDLARIEAGTFAITRHVVDSRDVIGEAVGQALPLAEAKHIALVTKTEALPPIDADPERVLQVLSNLLGNAIKFTPEGGTVTLQAKQDDGAVSIAVADTGPGIDPADIPHVFDRYWKSASKDGTGLGLYIANGIVQAHGGRIWVDATPRGATFTFTLPFERKPA